MPRFEQLLRLSDGMNPFSALQSAFALTATAGFSVCGRKKLPFAGYSVVKEPENLVENTGLEPVTSWLQTRRSPS